MNYFYEVICPTLANWNQPFLTSVELTLHPNIQNGFLMFALCHVICMSCVCICLTSSGQKGSCCCWSRKWCEDVIGECSEHTTPAAAWLETESQTPKHTIGQDTKKSHASWHVSISTSRHLIYKHFFFHYILLTFRRFSKLMRPPCEQKEFIF